MNEEATTCNLAARIRADFGESTFTIRAHDGGLTLTLPDDPVPHISIVPLDDMKLSVMVELYHPHLKNRIIPFDIDVDADMTWEEITEMLSEYSG